MSVLIFSTPIYAKEQAPAIQKNGINVWETVIPNSKLLGFKAKTVIDAATHEVLAVIMDVEHSGEWIPRTKSVETFENDKINGIAKVYIVDRELLLGAKIIHKANFDKVWEDAVKPFKNNTNINQQFLDGLLNKKCL